MMNRLFLLFLQEKLTGLCILSLEFLTEKSVRVLKIIFKQRTSLVVPSVLPMQGAQVPSLVRELDPTRCN